MRKRATLCGLLFVSQLSAVTKDIVVLRLVWSTTPPPVLTLTPVEKGKAANLTLNEQGLFLGDRKLCAWQKVAPGLDGPLGGDAPCPKGSPIQDASHFGYQGQSADSTPFTAVHVVSLRGYEIEVPYEGRLYKGELPTEFKVIPAKGTALEKQVTVEKTKAAAGREKALGELGLVPAREALTRCITPKLQPAPCFAAGLPSGTDKFTDNTMPGEPEPLSLNEVHARLQSKADFATAFKSCVEARGPKHDLSPNKNEIDLRYDDDDEMFMSCKFIRKNGKWLFTGMYWFGC